MDITLRTHRVVLSPLVRSYTEKRVRSALRRVAPKVESVRVWLVDSKSPETDREARCRILVKTVDAKPVMVDAGGERLAMAVDTASDRARQSLVASGPSPEAGGRTFRIAS